MPFATGASKGCESSLTKQPRVTSSNDSADDELLDTDGNSTGFTNPSPTMPTGVADSTHSSRRSSNLHLATQRRISAASVGIGSPKIQVSELGCYSSCICPYFNLTCTCVYNHYVDTNCARCIDIYIYIHTCSLHTNAGMLT